MTLSLNRVLLSAAVLVLSAAVIASGTGAFFSDTETSTGNTFSAGDIDLQIDNESYAIDFNVDPNDEEADGSLIFSEATSWEMADLVPAS